MFAARQARLSANRPTESAPIAERQIGVAVRPNGRASFAPGQQLAPIECTRRGSRRKTLPKRPRKRQCLSSRTVLRREVPSVSPRLAHHNNGRWPRPASSNRSIQENRAWSEGSYTSKQATPTFSCLGAKKLTTGVSGAEPRASELQTEARIPRPLHSARHLFPHAQ